MTPCSLVVTDGLEKNMLPQSSGYKMGDRFFRNVGVCVYIPSYAWLHIQGESNPYIYSSGNFKSHARMQLYRVLLPNFRRNVRLWGKLLHSYVSYDISSTLYDISADVV